MKLAGRLSSEQGGERRIGVQAGERAYEVVVGRGLLQRVGAEAARVLSGPRCAVVADSNTAAQFAETVLRSLREAGREATLVTVPAGEQSKSLEQVGRVCDAIAAARLDRSSFLVALGGGVLGDLAGFAAAIYHRGIPHVQVPTTLLAQVDSSIGGKTGVNTAVGKNLLGAVHQPSLVIADVETLGTLPPRELKQGYAEIIKHAIIADASLLEIVSGEGVDMTELVGRNVEIKARVVAQDQRDVSGERAVLNFGHTVGHAIERAGEYCRFLHGEAISLGIVAACGISMRRAGLPESDSRRVVETLARFQLPVRLPADFPREKILQAIAVDKKFECGEVRFVVSPRFGSAHLTTDVTMRDIEDAVARL